MKRCVHFCASESRSSAFQTHGGVGICLYLIISSSEHVPSSLRALHLKKSLTLCVYNQSLAPKP